MKRSRNLLLFVRTLNRLNTNIFRWEKEQKLSEQELHIMYKAVKLSIKILVLKNFKRTCINVTWIVPLAFYTFYLRSGLKHRSLLLWYKTLRVSDTIFLAEEEEVALKSDA